jgi:dTDP-4-dehydrorhamnose reductase
MRVLLTGVSGQIGGALWPRLGGHDVVAATGAVLDLAAPERIGTTLDRLAPDLIVNPAAYTAVDKAEEEPDLARRVNAEAPAAMARWAARRNVPLIHFSTDYVFDGSGGRPWREDDPTNPLSVYGLSKLAGEHAVQSAGGTSLIVRTSWVYAAGGRNFLRTIARLAGEKKELRVVDDQIGAPTSAASIADGIAAMIGQDIDSFRRSCAASNGLVHLAAAGETSWHGFATAIVEGLRTRGVTLAVERLDPVPSEAYPTRAKRPRNSRLDLTRLRDVFGLTPQTWADALSPELDRLASAKQ